jgi:tetratricopeptide (TPR) repeat protein
MSYYIQLRFHAQLEQAKMHLFIAKHSQKGKREIYLEYAEEVLKCLIQNFENPPTKWLNDLSPHEKLSSVWAEAEFRLAQVLEEKENPHEASKVLDILIARYHRLFLPQDYWFIKSWIKKGQLAQNIRNYQDALKNYFQAEHFSQFNQLLSPDERLDLFIQQSLCHQELHDYEEAMRLLSAAINMDLLSPLRIKAMFLRAEIYEHQGRPELALKQLEATARKGGEWGRQAQIKLEKIYGY